MKKISICLIATVLLSFQYITPVNAQKMINDEGWVHINDESEDVTTKEISFLDMVNEIAIKENRTKDSVQAELVNNKVNELKRSKLYTTTDIQLKQRAYEILLRANYRTTTIAIPAVTTQYTPKGIDVYHEYPSIEGPQMTIKKILHFGLDRQDKKGSFSKQFEGSLYLNLQDAQTIYWSLNGDFFNNGIMTVNGGGQIGIGLTGSASFGLSYASGHYAYYNKNSVFYMPRR